MPPWLKKFLASLPAGVKTPRMADDVFGDPTPTEMEILLDAAAGKPLPRTAAQGIADMTARITMLSARHQRIHERIQKAGNRSDNPLWTVVADINRQLTEATERLAEYKLQQGGLN